MMKTCYALWLMYKREKRGGVFKLEKEKERERDEFMM
jgi:hypothetical protein